jgi:hypothetical protein
VHHHPRAPQIDDAHRRWLYRQSGLRPINTMTDIITIPQTDDERDEQVRPLLEKLFQHLTELTVKAANKSEPWKMYFSGEFDSQLTAFERASNHLEIGVIANNKTTGSFCYVCCESSRIPSTPAQIISTYCGPTLSISRREMTRIGRPISPRTERRCRLHGSSTCWPNPKPPI